MLSNCRGLVLSAVVVLGSAAAAGCTGPSAAVSAAGAAGSVHGSADDMPMPTLSQLCAALPVEQVAPLVQNGDRLTVVPQESLPFLACALGVRSEKGGPLLQGHVSVSRPSEMQTSVADLVASWKDTAEGGPGGGADGSAAPTSMAAVLTEQQVDGHRAAYVLANHPASPGGSRMLRVDVADDLALEVFLVIAEGQPGDFTDPAPLAGIASTVMAALSA